MTQAMRQITSATTTGTPAVPAKAVCLARQSNAVVGLIPNFMKIGEQLAVESINAKDFSRLKPYADDCNATDDHTVACGMSVLFGFTRVLVQLMELAFDDGRLKFSNGGLPYRATEVSYAFMTGRGRFISLYNGATKTMARVLKAAPSFKISLASKSEAAAPAPIPVQIVGMPTRATTTDIERNGAGEIVSSLQVEKDF
jgi:hypothetical protein